MSIHERKATFVEEADAVATDVETEFDNISDTFNGLFQVGRVASSADKTLGVSYEDITGASLSITPAQPSILIVNAIGDIELTENVTGGGIIALNVDGSNRSELIEATGSSAFRRTVAQAYVVSLSAAAHTIKLQGKKSGGGFTRAKEVNTGFSYLLIPEP